MTDTVYGASPIKRRRATQDEMRERADFLVDYAAEHGPVTVRQLYYQGEMRHLPGIDKTEASYDKIQRQVLALRRAGDMPYQDIADLTRWMRKPRTYGSVAEALRNTARYYRKALWDQADVYVELWLEKDALAGVVYPVTEQYDVPLMVTRGYSSETFCFEAIEARADDDRQYRVYYLGDFDRPGQDAAASLWEKLERFATEKDVDITFVHLAIEPADIVGFDEASGLANVRLLGVGNRLLSTREPKRKTEADRKWPFEFACELDAISPDDLRQMVRAAIEQHLPPDQLEILKVAEESERLALWNMIEQATDLRRDDG